MDDGGRVRTVDINCDMGESFGAWSMGDDAAILPHVTSANIACGFHAGDPSVMRRTVRAALAHGVAVGAHPGLPDLAGFGRRAMDVTADEVYDMVAYQVSALVGIARTLKVGVSHVKAHGALYNMAARDQRLAEAIARAVADIDTSLLLFGLAGSVLVSEADRAGLVGVHEVFADRAYESDGTLTPRRIPGSMVDDPALAADRVVRMVQAGEVVTREGQVIAIRADTVCVHGDGAHAAAVAAALKQRLQVAGIEIRAPRRHPHR
jgi:UPF0271 protein